MKEQYFLVICLFQFLVLGEQMPLETYPTRLRGFLLLLKQHIHCIIYFLIYPPGAVILVEDEETKRYFMKEFLEQCLPFALLVLSSAPLAGIVMWLLVSLLSFYRINMKGVLRCNGNINPSHL